jgi:hypothetical protein
LTEAQIARWAQSHFNRIGKWPNDKSGRVADAPEETWADLDRCLRHGLRRLPGGDSLGRLTARRFGIRSRTNIPPLSVGQILAWADAHHARTGRWPRVKSGVIEGAPGETWENVDQALRTGCRGLRGGCSLPRLLTERRGRARLLGHGGRVNVTTGPATVIRLSGRPANQAEPVTPWPWLHGGCYLCHKSLQQRRLIIFPPDQINRYWDVQVGHWKQFDAARTLPSCGLADKCDSDSA